MLIATSVPSSTGEAPHHYNVFRVHSVNGERKELFVMISSANTAELAVAEAESDMKNRRRYYNSIQLGE